MLGYLVINLTYDEQVNYRAHEMLAKVERVYLPSANIKINQPYGDLFATSKKDPFLADIVEPREIHFLTDERGYRNRKLFKTPEFVLVGNSFVVGNGSTQDKILSEQLSKKIGTQVYSLSHTGIPKDYESYVRKNSDLLTNKKNFLLFYFEGNDFTLPQKDTRLTHRNLISIVKTNILTLEHEKSRYLAKVYPISFKFARMVNRKSRISYSYISQIFFGTGRNNKLVIKEFIGNQAVGFLSSYVAISQASEVLAYMGK